MNSMKAIVALSPFALMLVTGACGPDPEAAPLGELTDALARADGPTRLDFDVVAVSPATADLAWRARGLTKCTFAIIGGGYWDIAPNDGLRMTNYWVPGPESYTVSCKTKGAHPRTVSRTISVLWGDASSVQEVSGMRAMTGSLLAHSDDYQTDFVNNDLKLVAGAVEIQGEPNSQNTVSLVFAALESVGANLSIIDDPGFRSISFPSLAHVGTEIDITNDVALDTIEFPSLMSMGTSSTFGAQLDPLLSCAEIAAVYCGLDVQGSGVVVANNESATCPNIVPGC